MTACWKCDGYGCEEGCGRRRGGCQFVNAGPDSHKVCRECGGSGRNKASDNDTPGSVAMPSESEVFGRHLTDEAAG